jgi:hypothetical protein
MATTLAAKKAIWLRHSLCDLGEESKEASVICRDKQSIIALTQNPKFHSRSKHRVTISFYLGQGDK